MCCFYKIYTTNSLCMTLYDFDVFDNDEVAWIHDATVLFWPPHNLLKISPFVSSLSLTERLNANARLMILIGILAYSFLHDTLNKDKIVFLWIMLFIHMIQQGIAYLSAVQMQLIDEKISRITSSNTGGNHTSNTTKYYEQLLNEKDAQISRLHNEVQLLQRQTLQQIFPRVQLPKYNYPQVIF